MAKLPMTPLELTGIDSTNLVHTFGRGTGSTTGMDVDSWVATEDCYVTGFVRYVSTMGTNGAYVQIDGVTVSYAYTTMTSAMLNAGLCAPVKKGQTITMVTYYNCASYVNAYGVK